jgi:KaiC/GvpD/RAD55 family RecA-like ATPase
VHLRLGKFVIEEEKVVQFLNTRAGKASLNDIADGLGISKYGPNSAYALLQSLKRKDVVERQGELWVLIEQAVRSGTKVPEKPAQSPEKEETPVPDVEKLMRTMTKTITNAMKTAAAPAEEEQLTAKPVTTKIDQKEKLSAFVLKPDEAAQAEKTLIGFPTGTFIDNLFLAVEGKTLNGLPVCGQFAVTGLLGAGKSMLIEEIAIRVSASGRKVLFMTTEDVWKSATPRFDLQSRLKQKADALGLDWRKIRDNLFVLDTVVHSELHEWNTFAETYHHVAETEKIELALVDSVTALESYRGELKYGIMELARYNQVHCITTLYVYQRSAEVLDSYDVKDTIGLAENLDGTIIIDYGREYWYDKQVDSEVNRGELVRIARVLACRMSNFERRDIKIGITSQGFLRVIGSVLQSEETKHQ